MTLLGVLAALLALAPAAMLGVYTLEVLAGLRRAHADGPGPAASLTVTVLVPAHDEAGGVGPAVAALVAQGGPATRVLVVADNCSDDTAARARAAGAEVVERHDPARRGKGYALAFGREAMAGAPPDCVIIVDADCTMAPGGLDLLAREAVRRGRAVQSCYLLRPDPVGAPTAQISNFAFLMKNRVRQRGMARLGGVAALTGTGMAIPWPLFAAAPLASANLVEDLALGVWLTRAGTPPAYCDAAETWSDPVGGRDLMAQRRRWERGFLQTARSQALPLLLAGVARGSRSRLWLGLHLLVPPLALLFAASGAMLVVLLGLAALGAGLASALVLAALLAAAAMATVAAWSQEGRAQVSGRALLRAPAYVLMKLPLYRTMLGRGEATWVRTRRAGEGEDRG